MQPRNSLEIMISTMEKTVSPDEFMNQAKKLDEWLATPDALIELENNKGLSEKIAAINERRINIMINSVTSYLYDEYRKLSMEELADPDNYNASATAIMGPKAMEDLSETKFPMFIRRAILEIDNPELRALELARWIFAARAALDRNNIMFARGVYLALGVDNMQKMIGENTLSKQAAKELEKLKEFFDSSQNIETKDPMLYSISPFATTSRKVGGSLEKDGLGIAKAQDDIAKLTKQINEIKNKGEEPLSKDDATKISSLTKEIKQSQQDIATLKLGIVDTEISHKNEVEKIFNQQFVAQDYGLMIDRSQVSHQYRDSIEQHPTLNEYITKYNQWGASKRNVTRFEEKSAFNNTALEVAKKRQTALLEGKADPSSPDELQRLAEEIREREQKKVSFDKELEQSRAMLQSTSKFKKEVEDFEYNQAKKYRSQTDNEFVKRHISLVRYSSPKKIQHNLESYVRNLPNDEISKKRKESVTNLKAKFEEFDKEFGKDSTESLSKKIHYIEEAKKSLKQHRSTLGGLIKRILNQDTTINIMLTDLEKRLQTQLETKLQQEAQKNVTPTATINLQAESPNSTSTVSPDVDTTVAPNKGRADSFLGGHRVTSTPTLDTQADLKVDQTNTASVAEESKVSETMQTIGSPQYNTETNVSEPRNNNKDVETPTPIRQEIVDPSPSRLRGQSLPEKHTPVHLEKGNSTTSSLVKSIAKQNGQDGRDLLQKPRSVSAPPSVEQKQTEELSQVQRNIKYFESLSDEKAKTPVNINSSPRRAK